MKYGCLQIINKLLGVFHSTPADSFLKLSNNLWENKREAACLACMFQTSSIVFIFDQHAGKTIAMNQSSLKKLFTSQHDVADSYIFVLNLFCFNSCCFNLVID